MNERIKDLLPNPFAVDYQEHYKGRDIYFDTYRCGYDGGAGLTFKAISNRYLIKSGN